MKINIQKILLILTCLMLLGVLLVNDFKHALEFDSSFNLNVVKNIVTHGIYGTSVYLVDGQKYYWFDPWITTGPTVFLPTALLIKFIDNFVLVPRLVMNGFFFLFIFAIAKLIQKSQKRITFAWVSMLVISATIIFSKFINNATVLGVDFVGEVPAYLFTIGSIGGLALGSPMIAGLMIGLAVLTKLQLIYLCLPLSLGYLCYFYKKNIKSAVRFTFFGALPLLVYLATLLAVYGRNIKAYYGDFKGVAIMQKAYPTMVGGITSMGERFIRFLQYDPSFLLLSTVGLIIILLRWKKYDLKHKIIFASFSIYLGYFLFIWQFIAPRHLIIPKLLLFLFQCSVTLEYLSTRNIKKIITIIALISLLLFPSLIESGDALRNQIEAANHIRNEYGNATIYNVGWWKSPELQILLNKDFVRLDKKNREFCKQNCLLIIADTVLKNDLTIVPIASKYRMVDSFNGYNLYDLD